MILSAVSLACANRFSLYKGLYPLWARQIPYTMVKFATFESTVNQIYKTIGKPKDQLSTLTQTGVSFLGGYIAGIGCAVVSHPADVMVSKLNADRQGTKSHTRAPERMLIERHSGRKRR